MAREFFTAVNLHGNPVKGVPLPVDGTDATNKDYVDARAGDGLDQETADDLYVNVTGDTMTGPLTVNDTFLAVVNTAAGLTKLVVNNLPGYATHEISSTSPDGTKYASYYGGYSPGWTYAGIGSTDQVFLDGARVIIYSNTPIEVAAPGGVAPQKITNLATPTVDLDAANKAYVDGLVGAHTHPDTVSFQWTYDSVGTMTNPGLGKVRTDTAAGVPSTQIAFSDITEYGIDASATLAALTVGDLIVFQQTNNASNWGRYQVTAAPTDNSTWWLVPVEVVEMHGTAIAKNQDVLVRFTYGTGGGGGTGTGGTVILHGTPTPTADVGAIGNYYVDTDGQILYGPKGEGAVSWGPDVSAYTSQVPNSGMDMGADQVWGQDVTFAADGRITALRHYRHPDIDAAQTTKTLRLWHANGSQLAVAATSGESGPGWKTATLATPVAVVAGQTVRVSQDIVAATSPSVAWSAAAAPKPSNGGVTMGQAYYADTVGTRPTVNQTGNWFVDVVFQESVAVSAWPIAVESGLTEAEADALFLKPSEILAGTNITVTPTGGTSVTIASTGGGASTSDVSGRWTFSTNSTATPPYAGAIWVANPSGIYGGDRLMVTGVDAAGTNHDIGFDFLRPGDAFFLQKGVNWSDGDGASYTIRHRSATFNATYNTYVYAFGVVRSSTDNFIPATHTNGQPVRLYWFHNRKYGPGDYLLNENDNGGTSPDRGMIRFNGNPYYASLASLTMMYVSENDLAGHLSYLSLYNLVSGNQMRLSLGQGGEILLACSGTVVYATDATSGQYTFRIPVTVTARTGYLGQVARLEVIRGGGGSAVTPGAGLTQTGSAFNVVGDANLNVTADQVSVLSAPKWTTARTLALTGDVTGSVNIDGSANASLATTLVGGLTAATADALFLKPSEILAGSNVSVSTAGGAVTISSTATGTGADEVYITGTDPGPQTVDIVWLDESQATDVLPGGGGGLQTRTSTVITTASLAADASESGTVALANGYRLLKIATSRPARVRLYVTTGHRDADASRPAGTSPTGDHGVVLEFISAASLLTAVLSPTVDGYDGKATPDGTAAYRITNTDTGAGTVVVTLTWIQTEA